MPNTTTPALSTETTAAVFTAETLRTAAGLTADAYRPVWTGPSGEESTGEAVARHLDATIALLHRDGWARTTNYRITHSEDLPADDDKMTVKDMLRALMRLIRDETDAPASPLSLHTALNRVGQGDHGDTDTAWIAGTVLDFVIRAHTGSDAARSAPWSERQHRTHADITALLTVGAEFARAYGPGQETAAA
ncbi:DUF6197 family protein [Streptomyces clavifer]|uniref:DUF6197 family protein n=1 Tax=Streptomyces clavifer TaxID=68188 RepID=UPI00308629CC|nr:hypothetical protein OG388_01060 [Streptomyces clavifer]WRY86392.1 hypothetical protein OG388_36930 [Streptomyces clavifer]